MLFAICKREGKREKKAQSANVTFENACFANFFFSYAPSGEAIPSRRGQPCVKRITGSSGARKAAIWTS